MDLVASIDSSEDQQPWKDEQLFHITRFNFFAAVIDPHHTTWGTTEDWKQFNELISIDARMAQQVVTTLQENTAQYFSKGEIHWFCTEQGWHSVFINDRGNLAVRTGINPDFKKVFGLWLPMPTTTH